MSGRVDVNVEHDGGDWDAPAPALSKLYECHILSPHQEGGTGCVDVDVVDMKAFLDESIHATDDKPIFLVTDSPTCSSSDDASDEDDCDAFSLSHSIDMDMDMLHAFPELDFTNEDLQNDENLVDAIAESFARHAHMRAKDDATDDSTVTESQQSKRSTDTIEDQEGKVLPKRRKLDVVSSQRYPTRGRANKVQQKPKCTPKKKPAVPKVVRTDTLKVYHAKPTGEQQEDEKPTTTARRPNCVFFNHFGTRLNSKDGPKSGTMVGATTALTTKKAGKSTDGSAASGDDYTPDIIRSTMMSTPQKVPAIVRIVTPMTSKDSSISSGESVDHSEDGTSDSKSSNASKGSQDNKTKGINPNRLPPYLRALAHGQNPGMMQGRMPVNFNRPFPMLQRRAFLNGCHPIPSHPAAAAFRRSSWQGHALAGTVKGVPMLPYAPHPAMSANIHNQMSQMHAQAQAQMRGQCERFLANVPPN